MIVYKRFAILLSLVTFVLIFINIRSGSGLQHSKAWRKVPQVVGLGEWISDEEDDVLAQKQDSLHGYSDPEDGGRGSNIPSSGEVLSTGLQPQFAPGQPKPPGSTYTKAVVIGRLSSENVTWLDEAALPPSIQTFVYTVDASDPTTTLRIPKNKGHEAMVYLTYIIDHYSTLSDVTIFLHAHQWAWHNNELLNHNAAEMITRLSSERVYREGYMSLRCHWKPGCPEWVHPGVVGTPDINRPEEGAMAPAWSLLFPSAPIPTVIGTPCCAQFALSRDRILSIPLEKYIHFRQWLLTTPLPDATSGRVFEYLWSYIFTSQPISCPDQRICYCDGYGICFDSESEFDHWFELKYRRAELYKQLEDWRRQVDLLTETKQKWGGIEEKVVRIPKVDEDVRLLDQINALTRELERRRLEAMERGRDPRVRALMAGREWKEGDGY